MLVLERREGEDVVLSTLQAIPAGTLIEIKLTKICGRSGRVWLGFAAPRSVRIDRREVHEARTPGDGDDDAGGDVLPGLQL